jgi:hypothetical protein
LENTDTHTFGSGLLDVKGFARQAGSAIFFVSLVRERTCILNISVGRSSSEILESSFVPE